MLRHLIIGCACLALLAVSAPADYILTPLSDGAAAREVYPGDVFTLDMMLTSNAGDTHNSAIFQLGFTEPGLTYLAYDWASPYTVGLPYDDSTPMIDALPATIDSDLFVNPVNPTLVDVELSNVIIGDSFAEGSLTTLTVEVPSDFDFVGSVYIFTLPDTFALGFDEIPTTAGTPFELIILPEPTTLLAMLLLAMRPRR